jgi:ferritin-like metal-binding protein YciE
MNSSLNQWLRDAHAMEAEAAAVLSRQSIRMQNHPDLKARFELHLRETHAQRQRLEAYLERRPRLAGRMADESGKADSDDAEDAMDHDEMLKFAADFYVSKYREIATYRVLLAAAEAIEDSEMVQLCEEMLWVEDAMAAWLRVKLPELVRECLLNEQRPVGRRHENARHPHH